MYTYSVFLPHFFIWFRCKASILTRNIFFLLMSQSLFSRSAQKRTSTPGKERSGNHDFKQFNWVKAQNSNDPCDANLVSRKRWGEMVTMEVSASVDMCQPDGLATSDRGSPLTHCGCLPPYPPVTIAVIHRGYTCHWLLPTTCNRKKKKKVWAQPDLPLSSGQSCALCHKTGLEEWGWNPMFVFFSSSTLKYIWEILNIFI